MPNKTHRAQLRYKLSDFFSSLLEPELCAYKVAQKRECFVACFGADKMLIQVKEFLLSCP